MRNKQAEIRLAKSLANVDVIFDHAARIGFTMNPKKSRPSDITIKTYRKRVKTLLRRSFERYGIGDLLSLTADQIHEMISEIRNNFSAKTMLHALAYFQMVMVQTSIYRKPPCIVDKVTLLATFKEQKRIRRIDSSTVLKATQEDVLRVIAEVKIMKTKFKNQTITVLELQRHVGARIDGSLNLRNKDIVIISETLAIVHLLEKGGLKRTVKIWLPESVAFLKSLKQSCRSEKTRIITVRNQRTGQIKTNSEAAKTIEAIVCLAALRAGVSRDGKHFTPHSARKAFAQSRLDTYSLWSVNELEAEIEDRIKEDNHLNLETKYRKMVREESRRSCSLATKRKRRVLFLTATDIGHARINGVMNYYVTYKDGWSVKRKIQDIKP